MFKATLFVPLFVVLASFAAAAPAPLQSRQSGGVGSVTFFDTGLGACGNTNTDSDAITAISASLFDSMGSAAVCGRQISLTTQDGHSVTVTVEDRCTGCAEFDLDLTPSAFQQLASLDVGRLQGVSWSFI
ncbi:hypothetical protein M422DRAFT_69007 [Sphaerobolus stellatus SS14]|uniref:RlpA-like protein double-psi beta-barrel domain-containing protein n=1 Tax=Sphaerobolus stellatus (strain SS14) TaxID=990650 RepID=A0A0C9UV72_SPHS4|nr:hypothetical protein M422DRAFT_69007 [Sphaerobolus stellatus SS14]